MATQSLYRRYRPRRFSEVKGQEHVVLALRNAVIEGREGQAYLFSGPRGTGKTTCARILAKVLNCENVVDGEPCCVCESCVAVERGTSYDVHELDAASNNGVDAMRDLIEKASLGTPGRHKVYILDEVHMLSKAAEAALLKTLEEPPPHVVFVLATTDPQKMSDTIRSRTQHLQFHLLPADTLQDHVRWVVADAGLDVSDAAIDQVLTRGGGSARDTLSALELVATTGGEGAEVIPLEEFVESMIERDPGRGLTAIAHAIALGRDARTLTEDLIGHLRNGFLALMAPELVQLPSAQIDAIAFQAQRLGAPGLVRGIERLGAALVDMRHAPDPRVLLDVTMVTLTAESASSDVAGLLVRLDRLEQRLAAQPASAAPPATASPTPVDEAVTGRAALGGRARRAETPSVEAAATPDPPTPEPPTPDTAVSATFTISREMWDDTVKPGLRGMARAVYTPASFVSSTATTITVAVPNEVHRGKCEQHRPAVERQLTDVAGTAVTIELTVGEAPPTAVRPATSAPVAPSPAAEIAERGTPDVITEVTADDEFDEVDLEGLVDAPPQSVKTPIDRLAEAFPGSEMIEESGGAPSR